MNCDTIIDIMSDYLLAKALGNPVQDPDKELVDHCAVCPTCKEKMDIILRIITGNDFRLSRPLQCDDVLERIAEMVEVDEDELVDRFPAEWLHMQTCAECREVYEMTASSMTEEFNEAFAEVWQPLPGEAGTPDQSRIVWESVSPMVNKLSQQLDILVSRGKEALNLVPDWLASTSMVPVPAMVHRGAGGEDKYLYEVTIPAPQMNRLVTLQVYAEDPDSIRLRFQFIDSGISQAISGAAVALLDGEGRFLTQLFTPEISKNESWVEFSEIAPGNYILRVTEEQSKWEVPLHLG